MSDVTDFDETQRVFVEQKALFVLFVCGVMREEKRARDARNTRAQNTHIIVSVPGHARINHHGGRGKKRVRRGEEERELRGPIRDDCGESVGVRRMPEPKRVREWEISKREQRGKDGRGTRDCESTRGV